MAQNQNQNNPGNSGQTGSPQTGNPGQSGSQPIEVPGRPDADRETNRGKLYGPGGARPMDTPDQGGARTPGTDAGGPNQRTSGAQSGADQDRDGSGSTPQSANE